MKKAIVVFSRKGSFQTTITAREVRSREHARKLWPLVSPDTSRQMVTWVSPSFKKDGKLHQKSHFRILPARHTFDPKFHFDGEEIRRWRSVQESAEHSQAKKLVAAELSRRLNAGLAMPWIFRDADASDYALEGNLLLGADHVTTEHSLETPFGSKFRLDVAVLGPPIKNKNENMVLGGIEIELSHAFDGRKALIGKSIGFPLISIDITEMQLSEITPEWAKQVLTATTFSHKQGRRQTYIYLHDLLYPLYAKLPNFINKEQRHQFLVFAKDENLDKLVRWINRLAETLEYPNGAVSVARVNNKNEQSRKTLEGAGNVVGPDWRDFNDHQCLRLTIPRPKSSSDLQSHRFHMTMARILLSHTEALVGYKYCNGVDNENLEEDVWVAHHWRSDQKVHTKHRVLPKRLADPISRLIDVVSGLHGSSLQAKKKLRQIGFGDDSTRCVS